MESRKPYKWEPRTGPSPDAIARMRAHFKRPSELMGEAWFNTLERQMYPELNDPNVVRELKPSDVGSILFEISSGTSSFGHMDEWDSWFKYLLPDLIERSGEFLWWEQLLFQSVITSFMSIYWTGIDEEYEGFRMDIMASLSLCLMDSKLWFSSEDKPLAPNFLGLFKDGRGEPKLFWNAGEADANVSAAIFFCLKYLRKDEVADWVDSITQIPDLGWQGNLMVWLLGLLDLMNSGDIVPKAVEKARPAVIWEHSHVLGSTATSEEIDNFIHLRFNDNRRFLPPKNIALFLAEIRKYYTEERIIVLADRFSTDPYVAFSTSGIPESLFEKLYGGRIPD